MGRRRLEKRNTRKLIRSGGGRSVSVTVPIEMIRKLKWRVGQKIVIKRVGEKIIIEDWKK